MEPTARSHWPLFALRVHTKRLELRPDWDDGLAELAEVGAAGIHDPATMPFTEPWSDLEPGGDLERSIYQWHWRQRAEWTTEKWRLNFLVLLDGRVIGTQGIGAEHFAKLRVIDTGSWLGRRFHGQGIGTEMRAAALHFAFAGLGAERAESGAFHDNGASLGVSRKLGYLPNGERIHARREKADRLIALLLTRERWAARPWPGRIAIVNLEPCLPLFGLADRRPGETEEPAG